MGSRRSSLVVYGLVILLMLVAMLVGKEYVGFKTVQMETVKTATATVPPSIAADGVSEDPPANTSASASSNTTNATATYQQLFLRGVSGTIMAAQAKEEEFLLFTSGAAKFVPYPHRKIGVGIAEASCDWVTVNSSEQIEGYRYNNRLDAIQLAALEQGICLPRNKRDRSRLHVFSQAQATQCVMSQQQQIPSVHWIMTGDSYTRQLFIGLRDVFLGDPDNQYIHDGGERYKVLTKAKTELRENNLNVEWVCYYECYGEDRPEFNNGTFEETCYPCLLNEFDSKRKMYNQTQTRIVAVVGAGIHIYRRLHEDVNSTAQSLISLFNHSHSDLDLVWVSLPSFNRQQAPNRYKNATMFQSGNAGLEPLYNDIVEAAQRMGNPFLDVYQLTRACVTEKCSLDGGHRARYVNRWKAQLLLNMLCEIKNDDDPGASAADAWGISLDAILSNATFETN